MHTKRAPDFGRVAVVMGGDGAERDVSMDSGAAVLAGLTNAEVNAFGVDGIPALMDLIYAGEVDRVFNILHGRGGEDGTLQGALNCMGVPYSGSGVLGAAVSMDKSLSKRIWRDAGLCTADHVELRPGESVRVAAEQIGFPLVVKPVSEGSSVGISLVSDTEQLDAAATLAFQYERRIMLEQFISGNELTVGILQGKALPAILIETERTFYDYKAKYIDNDTRYLCPCGLDSETESALQESAIRAFELLGCSGWGRVDFIRDENGSAYLLEANTAPGMTSHSLVPKAAQAVEIGFEELVWKILETSFEEVAS